jgi:hypothetical protein
MKRVNTLGTKAIAALTGALIVFEPARAEGTAP